MKKVIELLGCKSQRGDIGIEIECEGDNMIALDEAVWRSEDDGSLRGHYPQTRCEYILAKPLKIEAIPVALTELSKRLKEANAVLDFSHRCSVHVHVNVQQLEYQQLLAFMYTYYLLEEPFMTYCGKSRKGNNFCLRLQDAEGVLEVVNAMFENGEEGIHHIGQDRQRYAAMNFEALRKYGSLEFRGMEGNMDVNRISTWCQALIRMRDFAVKLDNPQKVFDLFQQLDPVAFIDAVLGDIASEFQYARLIKDVQKSFSISLDLPFKFADFLKRPKDDGEYKLGQLVSYDVAVRIARKGYQLDYGPDGMYKIVVLPPRKKVAMPKAAFAPVGGWAVQPNIIHDEVEANPEW
jgi:hypothetical protein